MNTVENRPTVSYRGVDPACNEASVEMAMGDNHYVAIASPILHPSFVVLAYLEMYQLSVK
jgi:hypothetical protein